MSTDLFLRLRSIACRQGFLIAGVTLIVLTSTQAVLGGGPRYVAGVSYFNQGTAGTPLTWNQGAINYYTDQGSLSAGVSGPQADALVADAFNQWTSIPTAAVTASHAGQLAEDVSGANVYRNSDGTITMPADILPGAVGTPLGIVYDVDGSVTSALLGQGAGDSSQCFYNTVFGGLDNFGVDAHFLHGLVVMNGNCAPQLPNPDVEYRLVRVLGQVFGLGWSQTNLNVQTRVPPPTADDYAGFTIMHAVDLPTCVPISLCYSNGGRVNPYQPKADDHAAISRLYPGPSFLATTVRIHGRVYFADANLQPAQGMQGVNVVARWIDPSTNLPSSAYSTSSVSGFLFAGNVGSTVTGFDDSSGQPLNQYGSNDSGVEGFFDLAGLQIPDGGNQAQYQLSVEAVDPFWSWTVGPYQPWQVLPSGPLQTLTVNVSQGGDTAQDIVMQGSAVQKPDWFGPTTYAAPAALPVAGDWGSALGPYGSVDYFWLSGKANRTLSILVTALDELSAPSETKVQPVIGMWALSDPGTFPAPANTPSAFNSPIFGTTMLNAQLLAGIKYRVGIADIRGDGRPDYRYHARVLYGDHITPTRASVSGGTALAVGGYGFQANTTLAIASGNGSVLAASSNQLLTLAPAMPDGVQDITIIDPPTGASSIMSGVVTYGAGPNDTIRLLAGTNPPTPVGGQAPNPIRVQVLAPDGVTPIAGASVFFSATPAVSFSACAGGSSCTVLSDESGQASTLVSVLASGVMTITAQLAPASYPNPQQVQTTLLGTSSSLDLALLSPNVWIAQGATVNLTLTGRVLSNGTPVKGRTVNYYLIKGSGTVNPPSSKTNTNGYASSTLQVTSMTGDVQVSVCVEPGDAPCSTVYGTAVPSSSLRLQAISGDIQMVNVGTAFSPLTVRVTDQSTPPDPVLAAGVLFQSLIGRPDGDAPIFLGGDTNVTRDSLQVILGTSQTAVTSDANGLATIQPSTGSFQGALAILGIASAGASSAPFGLQSLWPVTQ